MSLNMVQNPVASTMLHATDEPQLSTAPGACHYFQTLMQPSLLPLTNSLLTPCTAASCVMQSECTRSCMRSLLLRSGLHSWLNRRGPSFRQRSSTTGTPACIWRL